MIQLLSRCPQIRAAALAVIVLIAPSADAGAENVHVRITLDKAIDGTAAPFLAARRGRFYQREKLDVSIFPGNGTRESIQRVASGDYPFGVAELSQLVRYIDQNPDAPIQAIMMLEDRTAFAVVGRKSRGVIAAKDLENKALGVTPPDPAFAHWAQFALANDIDVKRVRLESRGYVLREASLAQGQVDAVIGRAHSSPILLKQMGVPEDDITIVPLASGGLELFGNALIVNLDFADRNPTAVRGFVAATLHGFFEVIVDPVGHADDVLHYNENAARLEEVERIERFINGNVATPWVQSHGLGGIDMGRLTRSIRTLKSTYGLATTPSAQRIFSWNYLPPKDDRIIPERAD